MKNRISQYRYSDDPDEQDSFAEEYADVCDAAWKGMTNGDFDIEFGGETWVEEWQDLIGQDSCRAPVAPHDNSNPAGYSFDTDDMGTMTLHGVGAFLGAGIGLGAGLPLGNQMGQKLDIGGKQGKDNNLDPSERIKKLKDMLDKGLITEKQFNKKREEILKEL